MFLAAVLLLVVGCRTHGGSAASSTGERLSPPASSSGPPPPSDPPATSQPVPPPRTCAERTLARMSEPQRVGQLFLLGLAGDRLDPAEARAIRAGHFGSVWFTETSTAGTAALRAVTDAVQALATARATAGVRFYVGANQEGGDIQALAGPDLATIPSAVDQGTLAPSALRADAEEWGRELRGAGVNLDFAPVLDVVPAGTEAGNAPIGALAREYGGDPRTVAAHGVAFARGMAAAGVATTAKHFPGLGRVTANTDFAAGVVDRSTGPHDPYLRPFAAAIRAHVPFVMVALATYTRIDPARLAVFSPAVIQGMLRRSLGFRGVVMSDDMGAATAVASIPPGDRAVDFLLAGGDMIVSKTVAPARAMARALLARAAADPRFARLVDGAALRVLDDKQEAGLLPCG